MTNKQYAILLKKVSDGYGIEPYALALLMVARSKDLQILLNSPPHLAVYLRGSKAKFIEPKEAFDRFTKTMAKALNI